MPKKQVNALALADLFDELASVSTGVEESPNPWLEDPLPLGEFCRAYLDVTPWDTQQEDLSQFLGTTAADAKALFTQDPPTAYNCGILCYGKGCLGPDERLKDYRSGETLTVKEWSDRGVGLQVLSWDGNRYCLQDTSPVYCKGTDDLYRVTLADGRSFVATAKHRCLSPDGWMMIKQLNGGRLLTQHGWTEICLLYTSPSPRDS